MVAEKVIICAKLQHFSICEKSRNEKFRMLMFKECLANHIVPFIITDELKMYYYRGLKEWGHINGYLTDTCLTAQDMYKELLRYFAL